MYILFLDNLVENKQYGWFKVFTCCRWELRSFVRRHMVRDATVEAEAVGIDRQQHLEVFPLGSNGELKDHVDDTANIPIMH